MINKERKIKYVRVCECLCKYGLCYHISCKFAVKKSAEKTKRGWKMTDTQWEAGWSWWESHGCCSSSFLSAAFKQSGDTVSEGGHCNTPPVTDHVLSEYVQPLPRGAVSAEHPLVRTSPEARASMGLGGGVGVGGFSWAARSSQSDPPLRVRASVGGRDAGQQWQLTARCPLAFFSSQFSFSGVVASSFIWAQQRYTNNRASPLATGWARDQPWPIRALQCYTCALFHNILRNILWGLVWTRTEQLVIM